MKRDRIATGAIALVLGICLGGSGAMCLCTGFHLESFTTTSTVVVWALLLGILGAVSFSFRRGGYVVLGVLALLGGYLWRHGAVDAQLEKLLYMISRYYHFAYGWGIVNWGSTTPMGAVSLPLGLWAGLTALLVSFSLCRKKRLLLPLLFGSVPVIATLVVTDTPPETLPLFFFLASAMMLLLTNLVRRRSSHRDANRLTALLLFPVTAALGLLLFFIPRNDARWADYAQQLQDNLIAAAERLWNGSLSDMVRGDISDSDANMELTDVGPMEKATFRVMDVTADEGGVLYLRERDYNFYAYTYWGAQSFRTDGDTAPDGKFLTDAGDVTIHTVGIWEHLLLPYYPESAVTFTAGALRNTEKSSTYTYRRMALRPDWQELAFPEEEGSGSDDVDSLLVYGGDPDWEYYDYISSYKTLPGSTRKWASALLMEEGVLTSEQHWAEDLTVPEMAQAIASYVRGSAAYSLKTPAMPDGATDFAQWFLTESDAGYCVHFATATVVLLRAAGIPARYVEGYMVTVRPGQKTIVTAGDAHAWAEYYAAGVGWIPLESTPAIAGTGSPAVQETTAPTDPRETEVPTAPTETTAPTAPTTGTDTPAASKPEKTLDLTPLWTALKILGGLLLLFLATWGQWFLRRSYRTRKGASSNAHALILWQEVTRTARHLGDDPPEALLELAQKAKFSRHAITDEELEQFTTWLRIAQARLQARPWYQKLPDRLIWALY